MAVDFRNLNKVISNEGWHIPNMKEMIERIGSQRPARFAIADLTSRFSQMSLDEPCRQYTAFITFGVYTNGPEYLWAFDPQLTFPKKHGRTRTQRPHL